MASILQIGAIHPQKHRTETRYSDQFDPHVRAAFLRASDIAAWLPGWAKARQRDLAELLSEAGAEEWLMFAELSAAAFKRPIPSDSKPYYPSLITRTLTFEILRLVGRVA